MHDTIAVTPRADETYVVLSGRIDSHEVVRLAEILDQDANGDASNTVYLDLSAVTFVDRSALVALRVGRDRRRAFGGDLRVVALSASAIFLDMGDRWSGRSTYAERSCSA